MADKGGLVGGVIQNLIAGGAAWACGQGTVAGCRAIAPDFVATIGEKAAEALGYGVAILLFLLWLGVWLFWLRPLWALGQRAATGRAKGDRIAVLVCDLDGDDGARAADRVADALTRNLGKTVEVRREPVSFKRAGYGRVEDRDRQARQAVQRFIKAKRADLAVWGQSDLTQSVLHLVFTKPQHAGRLDLKSYRLDETLQLPAAFDSDLRAVLAALIIAAVAPNPKSRALVDTVLDPIAIRLTQAATTLQGEAAGNVWDAIGDAQLAGGEGGNSIPRLVGAVDAYRAALRERNRAKAPLDWATTQNNLGNALLALGEREFGTARLDEAVDAYRGALIVRTREQVPMEWAATQKNLANTLSILGGRERGTARLEDAVSAYDAVLHEGTRERDPLEWASTRYNQAHTFGELYARTGNRSWFDKAIEAASDALELFESAGANYHSGMARTMLNRLLAKRDGPA